MSKLIQGEYTKEQLFTILGKKDLSNIKRGLSKQGYRYTTNNKRGNNYRLIIESVPVSAVNSDNFRNICRTELNIRENIDFTKFAILICFLEYDTNFIDLTLEQMETHIKEVGFILSRKTIAKYLESLERNNLLVTFYSEYIYYITVDKTRFITKEEWLDFWRRVYKTKGYAYKYLVEELGNRPYKRNKRYFGNALVPAYKELISSATAIVKEIRNNE